MNHEIRQRRAKLITLVIGNMNARIQKANTREEDQYIGKHTFEPATAQINNRTEGVIENRNLLISMSQEIEMKPINTYFKKPEGKKATFREVIRSTDV